MTNNHPENQTSESFQREEKAREVADYCQKIVDHLGFRLTVEAQEQDGTILVDLEGVDKSMLMANSASVLNGIEYLANKSFRTGRTGIISYIVVDSDSYRKHREAELTLMAKMASEKVISLRQSLVLQPMTPKERRIVHLALAEIEGVRSESEGMGEHRSVAIHFVK